MLVWLPFRARRQRSVTESPTVSIIPKFFALGLATILGSTGPQRQIDFGMPGPDSQHFNQLWLVTYVDEAGKEVLAVAKLANGQSFPLIAADQVRVDSMMPTARVLAKSNNLKMRLIKFERVGTQDIVP
jgi:hypothetical protein